MESQNLKRKFVSSFSWTHSEHVVVLTRFFSLLFLSPLSFVVMLIVYVLLKLLICSGHYIHSVFATIENANGSLSNDDGEPINQGASSSFQPWDSMPLSDGWTVSLRSEQDITYWVPVGYSAANLENFWQRVFEATSAQFWSGASPSSSFQICMGALTLFIMPTFTTTPLPWHVVAQFAWAMLNAAKRGYTAGFSVRLQLPSDRLNGASSGWVAVLVAGFFENKEQGFGGTSLHSDGRLPDRGSDGEPLCKRQCPPPHKKPT